ncbi:MAG TPA: MBL fold metallo-hydrolase [Nocardioidaceae bacterium]|nr:MBL fold metallo-hydrolase [Nocardioidaceae bacterium]
MESRGGDRVLGLSWLGHSTVVLELDGVRVLTDPLLRPHAGLLRRIAPRPDPAHWHGPDVVLISHLHHDHAELRSLRMLPDVPVMSSPTNAAWLRRRGLASAAALGEEWTRLAGGSVDVRLVPAVHHHRPMPHRPNDAHGHLVRGPSAALWVAGDTSLYPEMSSLPVMAGGRIDVAIVPIGGWGPRLSEGHMNPEQAARACAISGARWAVPVHWGTLHPPLVARFGKEWLETPGEHFAEALRREAPGCEAVVLEPGERRVIRLEAGGPTG